MSDLKNELQIKLVLQDERNRGKEEVKHLIYKYLKSKVVTLKENTTVIHAEYLEDILTL